MADQKKVSRRRFLVLSSSAAAAGVLAACGAPEVASTTGASASASTAASTASTASSAAASTPAGANGTTLTYWVGLTPQITATRQTMAELTCYQDLMKATGINIAFQHPPTDAAQAREQFNLMIASGKYPGHHRAKLGQRLHRGRSNQGAARRHHHPVERANRSARAQF